MLTLGLEGWGVRGQGSEPWSKAIPDKGSGMCESRGSKRQGTYACWWHIQVAGVGAEVAEMERLGRFTFFSERFYELS